MSTSADDIAKQLRAAGSKGIEIKFEKPLTEAQADQLRSRLALKMRKPVALTSKDLQTFQIKVLG